MPVTDETKPNDNLGAFTSYKEKYSSMKTKLKEILYENELFQDELRKLKRELLDIYSDKETLLEQVIQFEDVDSSNSDSESQISDDIMSAECFQQIQPGTIMTTPGQPHAFQPPPFSTDFKPPQIPNPVNNNVSINGTCNGKQKAPTKATTAKQKPKAGPARSRAKAPAKATKAPAKASTTGNSTQPAAKNQKQQLTKQQQQTPTQQQPYPQQQQPQQPQQQEQQQNSQPHEMISDTMVPRQDVQQKQVSKIGVNGHCVINPGTIRAFSGNPPSYEPGPFTFDFKPPQIPNPVINNVSINGNCNGKQKAPTKATTAKQKPKAGPARSRAKAPAKATKAPAKAGTTGNSTQPAAKNQKQQLTKQQHQTPTQQQTHSQQPQLQKNPQQHEMIQDILVLRHDIQQEQEPQHQQQLGQHIQQHQEQQLSQHIQHQEEHHQRHQEVLHNVMVISPEIQQQSQQHLNQQIHLHQEQHQQHQEVHQDMMVISPEIQHSTVDQQQRIINQQPMTIVGQIQLPIQGDQLKIIQHVRSIDQGMNGTMLTMNTLPNQNRHDYTIDQNTQSQTQARQLIDFHQPMVMAQLNHNPQTTTALVVGNNNFQHIQQTQTMVTTQNQHNNFQQTYTMACSQVVDNIAQGSQDDQLSAEELEQHLESRRMEQAAALLMPDWESNVPNEIFGSDSAIKFMAED